MSEWVPVVLSAVVAVLALLVVAVQVGHVVVP